jgi:cell pole-organizing protein PopZ
MEEILASINRIIADEKKPGDATASGVRAAPVAERPAAEQKSEVLDLTEAVGEDGTVRRIAPKGPAPAPRDPAKAADRIEPEPPRVTASGSPGGRGAPGAAGEPTPPAAPAPSARGTPDEAKPDPTVREHVLAAAAAGAAAAALGRLATAPRAGREPEEEGRREGAHTLEDIVREALRPLLQAWLDAHLPELAEKLAREEIARIVQAAGLR